MISEKNRQLLRGIMDDNRISVDQVASALKRSRWTVYQWRAGVANVPDHQLELLQLLIETGRLTGKAAQ